MSIVRLAVAIEKTISHFALKFTSLLLRHSLKLGVTGPTKISSMSAIFISLLVIRADETKPCMEEEEGVDKFPKLNLRLPTVLLHVKRRKSSETRKKRCWRFFAFLTLFVLAKGILLRIVPAFSIFVMSRDLFLDDSSAWSSKRRSLRSSRTDDIVGRFCGSCSQQLFINPQSFVSMWSGRVILSPFNTFWAMVAFVRPLKGSLPANIS